MKRLVLLTGVRHEACVQYRIKSGPTRNGLIKRLVLLTVVLSRGDCIGFIYVIGCDCYEIPSFPQKLMEKSQPEIDHHIKYHIQVTPPTSNHTVRVYLLGSARNSTHIMKNIKIIKPYFYNSTCRILIKSYFFLHMGLCDFSSDSNTSSIVLFVRRTTGLNQEFMIFRFNPVSHLSCLG